MQLSGTLAIGPPLPPSPAHQWGDVSDVEQPDTNHCQVWLHMLCHNCGPKGFPQSTTLFSVFINYCEVLIHVHTCIHDVAQHILDVKWAIASVSSILLSLPVANLSISQKQLLQCPSWQSFPSCPFLVWPHVDDSLTMQFNLAYF